MASEVALCECGDRLPYAVLAKRFPSLGLMTMNRETAMKYAPLLQRCIELVLENPKTEFKSIMVKASKELELEVIPTDIEHAILVLLFEVACQT